MSLLSGLKEDGHPPLLTYGRVGPQQKRISLYFEDYFLSRFRPDGSLFINQVGMQYHQVATGTCWQLLLIKMQV